VKNSTLNVLIYFPNTSQQNYKANSSEVMSVLRKLFPLQFNLASDPSEVLVKSALAHGLGACHAMSF
jgi:hypothetical protein